MEQHRKLYRLSLAFLLSCFLSCLQAQSGEHRTLDSLKKIVATTHHDSTRVHAMVWIGWYYQKRAQQPGLLLDTAMRWYQQAATMGQSLHTYTPWQLAIKQISHIYYLQQHYLPALEKRKQLSPILQVELLWEMADDWQKKHNARLPNYDSAYYYFNQALEICEKGANSDMHTGVVLQSLADLSFKNNKPAQGRAFAQKAILYLTNYQQKISKIWYDIGKSLDNIDVNYPEILRCYDSSISAAIRSRDTLQWYNSLLGKADIHCNQGLLKLSEQEYNSCMILLRRVHRDAPYHMYFRFAELYRTMGHLDKAVHFYIEAIRAAQPKSPNGMEYLYGALALVYFFQGEYDKAIESAQSSQDAAKKNKAAIPGIAVRFMSKSLIAQGRAKEALSYVLEMRTQPYPLSDLDKTTITEALAHCYHSLHDPTLAEKYYLQAISLAQKIPLSYGIGTYFSIGQFYYETQQYEKASSYLSVLFEGNKAGLAPAKMISEAHLMLYTIDSTRHDYLSAMQHLRAHKQLSDSLFNESSSRQIAETEIRYEVEKKNKDLLLKDQSLLLKEKDIELLRSEGKLQAAEVQQKQQNIDLQQSHIANLSQEAALQKALAEKNDRDMKLQQRDYSLLKNQAAYQEVQLKQAGLIRKITIASIILLAIILILLYRQYSMKKRNIRQVSDKNKILSQLLCEKEWLVKEVHHRVKNNLQVMLSLLESQSVYLSQDALSANLDSQHRMQAMSLIHQRLYQADNISTVDMQEYITELVEYLEDSYDTRRQILFRLDIAPFPLDVAKAVPLGLILNEVITNAIKHAFNGQATGTIALQMEKTGFEAYRLTISDDGKGLPPDFDIAQSKSLGTKLIHGLSQQINGKLSIQSDAGTVVTLDFEHHAYSSPN